MKMIIAFVIYFVIFILIFASPKLKDKSSKQRAFYLFGLPLALAIVFAFLSVVKVYFAYKIIILLIFVIVGILSFWQFGGKFRNFR